MGSKDKIFMLLQGADGVLSGEGISRELGISRVSVWKHVKAMKEGGIPIESSAKGYRLLPDPDRLNPMECGDFRDLIHYFQETGSTMNEATTLARNGCPEFTVVVAERQSQGRGRMQRVWSSADGGLYFTVIIRPDIPLMLASLVNLAAAVDMAELLVNRYQIPASLKWPNDILVEGRKICGLLSQMEAEGGQIAHLNIGIGLNVNNHPEQQEPMAVSLQGLLGHPVPRREILLEFLQKFKQRCSDFDSTELLAQWKANNSTIGKLVSIRTVKEQLEGMAVDIDEHGGLVLETKDGSRTTAIHGDCFYN